MGSYKPGGSSQWLSRPGARRGAEIAPGPFSPGRSPNPPCRSPGDGLSTVSAVVAGYAVAQGLGILLPRYRYQVTSTLAMLNLEPDQRCPA
jgi:hypothetical protein